MKRRMAICLIMLTVLVTNIQAKSDIKTISFRYYGSQWSVRFSKNLKFAVPDTTQVEVFDTVFIEKHIQETFEDCLSLKKQKRLNDWGYINMLDSISVACFGKSNEATLMKAYLYAKSGYKMRLFRDENNSLFVGYQTKYNIYGYSFLTIANESFYVGKLDKKRNLRVLRYRNEGKPLSLDMRGLPLLDMKRTKNRILTSKTDVNISISVSVNQNLLDFYAQYPCSSKNYDFMTKWSMMANIPLDEDVKQQIYPTLRKELEGLSQYDKVNKLLRFVQTAFDYEYDENVWGYDRAFFAEETLFYPFADIEDRTILLSRLVRDLVGLEVALLYYPGHLPLGVHFDEDVEGASVIYNGDRFIVCDPVYIRSDVGESMRQFADEDPQRIILLYR